ncbi:hypothetical protein KUTeg_024735 [Tegillarca granosa]|uniref:EF-hand domain-containing protein n=1 Tax=Tegillarca granosa TaxID=220873 RepID=A0ABQ9DY45_TEGGR|nr:hypothetical protein KUTeg_024735 [Tegillarca granosa]
MSFLNNLSHNMNIEPIHDTTLLRHFFGPKGKDVLKFNDFANFMENLQDEVLEIEFMEFSRGMATISEEDFARILLRYTMLDKGDIETCINRGLSFKEFKEFCQFLNSLDDFAIAMKMYTYAQQPVSKEQFQRAVKVCTGNVLSPHLVNTVFQIFDEDGDGHLSHKEFISIMKDRLHRGSRLYYVKLEQRIFYLKWKNVMICLLCDYVFFNENYHGSNTTVQIFNFFAKISLIHKKERCIKYEEIILLCQSFNICDVNVIEINKMSRHIKHNRYRNEQCL